MQVITSNLSIKLSLFFFILCLVFFFLNAVAIFLSLFIGCEGYIYMNALSSSSAYKSFSSILPFPFLTLMSPLWCIELEKEQKIHYEVGYKHIQDKIFDIIMSQLSNTHLQKSKQRQLAIRRAQYLKNIKIKVQLSQKIIDEERLVTIETFIVENNKGVELVMRRLSQLDTLVTHMNMQYGGHVIPAFTYDLFDQKNLKMEELVPDIQQYLNDLKSNKYCRQDVRFYCFLIQQNASFFKEMGFNRIINNATDKSRRYLNDLFTRKQMPALKDTNALLIAQEELKSRIDQYYSLKQLSIIKIKQTLLFEEVSQLFVEMSAWPGIAIQPQQFDKQFVYRTIKSCEKLIKQSKQAYKRWDKLVDNVRQLQHNVYKGLHEFEQKFNYANDQLKQWSESLSREFSELSDYLSDKTQILAGEVFKINKKFLDMTVFSGQSIVIEDEEQKPKEIINQVEQSQQKDKKVEQQIQEKQVEYNKLILNEKNSFKIIQQIEINSQPKVNVESQTPQIQLKQKQNQLTVERKREEITCQDD